MSKKNKLTYEKALSELQEIAAQLQDELISMDDLSEKIKRAAELVDFCKNKLRNIEEEVDEFMRNKNER